MRFLLAFIFLFSQTTFGQTTGKQIEFNSVNGVDYFSNLIINPSAFKNANDISGTCTVTRDTSSTYYFNSKGSFSYSCTTGQYIEWTLSTPSVEQTQGNCEFKGKFQADTAGMVAQVLDGSSNVLNSATLTLESTYRDFSVNYPCGASGARKVRLHNGTAGTITGHTGKLYYGSATNIGAGVPNSHFSAKISSTGVVSDENEDWLSGNCTVSGTSLYICTFLTSKFSIAPTCTITARNTGAVVGNIQNDATLTSISWQTFTTNTAGAAASNFTVTCDRAGTDFIQPTITASQWDYADTAYTPSTGNMPTLSSATFKHSRKGSKITITGEFVASGTGTAGTLTVGLPTNISLSATPSGVGTVRFLNSGVSHQTGNVTVSGSNLVFYLDGASNVLQGTDVTSGDSLQFSITFQVSGWTENQNAPQLVGSVTSNASGASRIESADVSAAGVVSNQSSSWLPSCTPSGNNIACSISPAFSSKPACQITSSTATQFATIGTNTTDAIAWNGYNNAGGTAATAVTLTCIGPR